MNREWTWQGTAVACFVVCFAAPLAAAAQSQETKPQTAVEKPQPKKEKPAPPPRRAREPQERDSEGERPRLDVPVSFPVDI